MPDKENFQHYQHLAAHSHHHPHHHPHPSQFNFWPHPTPFHAAQAAAAAAAASGISQHNPFAQYYGSNPHHHHHHPFGGGAGPAGSTGAVPSASGMSANPPNPLSTSLSSQKYGPSPFFPSSMAGSTAASGPHPVFGMTSAAVGAMPSNASGSAANKWAPPFHGQLPNNGSIAPSSAFVAFQGSAAATGDANERNALKANGLTSGTTPETLENATKQQQQQQHHQQERKKSAVEVMDIDVVHGDHKKLSSNKSKG